MENNITELLKKLYYDTYGCQPEKTTPITGSGSNRKYYRITSKSITVIGVYNTDIRENEAFIYLSNHFLNKELPVANVLATDLSKGIYLLEDLGDISLFSLLSQRDSDDNFPNNLVELYKKSIDSLIKFQIHGIRELDTSICYPRDSFDRQSILWDLNYFKYYFAKLIHVDFDEEALENDFNSFADLLLNTDTSFFMYRDFQSRNIMIKNSEPYFIDFQGGRKGALQYDLASLLYQAKAKIPQDTRDDLLSYYISSLNDHFKVDKKEFTSTYNAYVLIRLLQVLGAYGYRGYYEKKLYFKQSIPPAIKNLANHISKCDFLKSLPELKKAIDQLLNNPTLKEKQKSNKLEVSISSFSYKNGVPEDDSGNGGGFVFDCRAIINPGRIEEYKTKTGMDKEVIDFFSDKEEMHQFLKSTFSIIDSSVETYLKRGFTSLMVNFGCTGGQHRSVFSAENLAKHLHEKYDVNISLRHIEQNISKTY